MAIPNQQLGALVRPQAQPQAQGQPQGDPQAQAQARPQGQPQGDPQAQAQAQAQARPQGQPQGDPQAQAPQPTTFDTNVTGEEQDAYDRVVTAGMKVMFDDGKTKQAIVDRLKADAGNPAKNLADTASMLMIQLDQQSGGKIPEAVILPAAGEILEHLGDLADSLKLFPIDDAVMNRAGQLMVASLGDEYGVDAKDIQGLIDSTDPADLKNIVETQGNYARKQPPQEAM